MKTSTDKIRELREKSGASVMACRNALVETKDDIEKALQILKEQNLVIVEKKKGRSTSQGVIEAYIHAGGRIGAMIELNCESDFVARTDEFKQLAHNLAMQVAAMPPKCIVLDDMPKETELSPQEACLLMQPFIKDLARSVQDVINETIAKVGENITISRYSRFELGE